MRRKSFFDPITAKAAKLQLRPAAPLCAAAQIAGLGLGARNRPLRPLAVRDVGEQSSDRLALYIAAVAAASKGGLASPRPYHRLRAVCRFRRCPRATRYPPNAMAMARLLVPRRLPHLRQTASAATRLPPQSSEIAGASAFGNDRPP